MPSPLPAPPTELPRPSKVVRNAVLAGFGAGASVTVLAAVAYLQARLSVLSHPHDLHHVGGHVGATAGPVECHIVWLGDSLAAGLGAISPDLSLPRLVAMGRDERTRLHVFATPGATSHDVLVSQLPALDQLRHGLAQIGERIDAVGVTVGANDIAAMTPRPRFRHNVESIIDAAEGVPIVLVSIPQINDAIRIPRPLRTFASWRASWLDRVLRAAADRHAGVHYASVRRRPAWIRRQDLQNFLSADRFHPSGAGYAVWAARVADAFDRALSPEPLSPAPVGTVAS